MQYKLVFLKKNWPWIALACFVFVFMIATWQIISITQSLTKSQTAFEAIAQDIAENRAAQSEQGDSGDSTGDAAQTLYYPDIENLVGWIAIEDTVIDYPVMCTPDDPEYYLHRDLDGNYSFVGVPFLDARCTMDSAVLIVYGHNMNNGTMFAAIKNYTSSAYWQEHLYIQCDSLTELCTYEVIAALEIGLTEETLTQYYELPQTQEEFEAYVASIKANALYDTGIDATFGDQLLVLSTCSSVNDEGRCIVVARKIS